MVRHHVTWWIGVCAILSGCGLANGCSRDQVYAAPQLDPSKLRSGDLVFRVGVGWRADAVRLLSRGSLTHVGIAIVERDGVHVVHAEPPGESGPGGVVDQRLPQFSSPTEASGVVAYRRIDVNAATDARIAVAASAYARRHVPFDDRFDLSDGRAVYCTELVLRASLAAHAPLRIATETRVASGPFAGTYVFPRDLLAAGRFLRVGA